MTERTYVAPISFGLGDLVVSLPVIQAVIAEGLRGGSETWLVARSQVQALLAERIDEIAGCVLEESLAPDDPGALCGRRIDLRDHPLQRDHWWGSADFEEKFGPLCINDILERISTSFGIHADFTRPVSLRAFPRPEVSDSILLVTESDGPSKQWPADRWALLAAKVRAMGLQVRQVCRSGPGTVAGVDAIEAPTPGDAVDLLTSCRAVVGIDTGLTHLAAEQGTATVTICRRGNVFLRPFEHCRVAVGAYCDSACLAADLDRAYNQRIDLSRFQFEPLICPAGNHCLQPIDVGDVFGVLKTLL